MTRRKTTIWIALFAIWLQVFTAPGLSLRAFAADLHPPGGMLICAASPGGATEPQAPGHQHDHHLCDCCLSATHHHVIALLAPTIPPLPTPDFTGPIVLLSLFQAAPRAPPHIRPAARAPPVRS